MASVWIGKLIWFLCLKNAELTKLVAINIEYKYELVRLWDVHLESKLFTLGQYLEKKYIYRFECTCKYVASIKQNTESALEGYAFFHCNSRYLYRPVKERQELFGHAWKLLQLIRKFNWCMFYILLKF